MADGDAAQLDKHFGIPGQISFAAGPGGLTVAELRNPFATAQIALHGGHVLSYQPAGQAPVLWVSSHSRYEPGTAIRGGIPVCWPWFADHPSDATKPAHGLARTATWEVVQALTNAWGAGQLRLRLEPNAATRALWPFSFRLELVVTVGAVLEVELMAGNTGHEPFRCTAALHSYFAVRDATQVRVRGLEGRRYIDKVDGGRTKVQEGAVTISGEVDRVYLDSDGACAIEDPVAGRRIEIAKSGSRSTVVWNPGPEKARRMRDFGDEEYRETVCVETANVGEDIVTIAPGGEHRLRAAINATAL